MNKAYIVLYCIVLYNFIVHRSEKLSLAHQHSRTTVKPHTTLLLKDTLSPEGRRKMVKQGTICNSFR